MAVVFVIFGGTCIFSCIQLFLLKRVGHRRYICLSDSCERRSSYHICERSIVWSSGLPCDPIALSHNTRFNWTTVAYRCKKNRKVQLGYIAQRSSWIVRVSYEYYFICDYFGKSLRTISNIFGFTNILSRPIVKGALGKRFEFRYHLNYFVNRSISLLKQVLVDFSPVGVRRATFNNHNRFLFKIELN